MNKHLSDTKVVSELRKPRPHGGVVAWLNHQEEEDQLFLSAVTMGQFQAGIERTRRRDPSMASDVEFWADQLAALCQIPPMDTPCVREWGRIMARKPDRWLEHAMIAPTARVHQLIVVTRNEADFRQLDVRILNPFRTSWVRRCKRQQNRRRLVVEVSKGKLLHPAIALAQGFSSEG
jgi:predicted nucleic acid-binding protein